MTTSVCIVNCGPKPIKVELRGGAHDYNEVNAATSYFINPTESKTVLVYTEEYICILED